jgi:nucleoside-triphosphatase THEP1
MNTATIETNPTPAKARKPALVEALRPEDVRALKAFAEAKVKHPKLLEIIQDLRSLLTASTDSNIIVITGATGVGKTTLSRELSRVCQELFRDVLEGDPSAIPAVWVEAYANGDRQHGFKSLYEDLLKQLLEPGMTQKHLAEVKDGKLTIKSQGRATIPTLRNAVESSLCKRKTIVCAIDEAYHLLRFSNESAVMDTFKSLANTTGAKFVLIGSFDLFDLVAAQGQVARRAVVLNFDRYHIDKPEDVEAFKTVVIKLQSKWPCAQVPNFKAVSRELMDAALGCVGLLKSLMLEAAAMQMANKGKWEGRFLAKAAKANRLREIIRKEIEAGEAKVRDALLGECLWGTDMLAEMSARMEAGDA